MANQQLYPTNAPTNKTANRRPRHIGPVQLDGEAEAVMVTTTLVDQRPVDVVEKEAVLQLRSARWIDEASVTSGLVVAEELDGHAA